MFDERAYFLSLPEKEQEVLMGLYKDCADDIEETIAKTKQCVSVLRPDQVAYLASKQFGWVVTDQSIADYHLST